MNSKNFIGLGLASCLLLTNSSYLLDVNNKIEGIKSIATPLILSFNTNMVTIDDSKINALKEGEKFNVVLNENATTGYLWSFNINNEGIEFVDQKNIISDDTLVGSPSKKIWTFRATKKGNFKLEFSYARPWEKNTPAIKTIEYTVDVK